MAMEAEGFLSEEASRLTMESKELESRLAEIKGKDLRLLPEVTPINKNIMDPSERGLFDVNAKYSHAKSGVLTCSPSSARLAFAAV